MSSRVVRHGADTVPSAARPPPRRAVLAHRCVTSRHYVRPSDAIHLNNPPSNYYDNIPIAVALLSRLNRIKCYFNHLLPVVTLNPGHSKLNNLLTVTGQHEKAITVLS